MADLHPYARTRLQDPLTEISRRERRNLLATSAVALMIVITGFVPTKISALGVEFSAADQRGLLWVLALVVFYFLLAFVVYALTDFVTWRVILSEAWHKASDEGDDDAYLDKAIAGVFDDLEKQFGKAPNWRWVKASRPVAVLRALFDFVLPVCVGVAVIAIILAANVPDRPPQSGVPTVIYGAPIK